LIAYGNFPQVLFPADNYLVEKLTYGYTMTTAVMFSRLYQPIYWVVIAVEHELADYRLVLIAFV
jgi:hypothetical protein